MRKTLLVFALVMLGLMAVLVGTLPFVPAAYLARWVDDASAGRVLLAETQGTVWSGSARVVFVTGGQIDAKHYTPLPGRLAWRFDEFGIAPLRVGLRLSGDQVIGQPFRMVFARDQVRVEPGNIRLPADLIEAAGAPFNTLRLGGELLMSWDTLSAHFGTAAGLDGRLTLDWSDARSALSPVAPLGSYRLTAHGNGAQIGFELATIKGPLLLSGNGQWTPQRVQFRGEAQAEPSVRTELGPLIGLLGRPSANGAELRFGS
jgi:general secretion pathway protein N